MHCGANHEKKRFKGKPHLVKCKTQQGGYKFILTETNCVPEKTSSCTTRFLKGCLISGILLAYGGELFKTQVGEITVLAKELTVLSKSIKPLPLPKTDAEEMYMMHSQIRRQGTDSDMLTLL